MVWDSRFWEEGREGKNVRNHWSVTRVSTVVKYIKQILNIREVVWDSRFGEEVVKARMLGATGR